MNNEMDYNLEYNFNDKFKIMEVLQNSNIHVITNAYKFFSIDTENIYAYYLFANNRWYTYNKSFILQFPQELKKISNIENMFNNLHL